MVFFESRCLNIPSISISYLVGIPTHNDRYIKLYRYILTGYINLVKDDSEEDWSNPTEVAGDNHWICEPKPAKNSQQLSSSHLH